MMRSILILFSLVLTACASTPDPQIHSYFLELQGGTQTNTVDIGITDIKVKVARYLAQPGIVLKTGPNQLTAAHYHRWAEPLTEGIRRVLIQRLNVEASNEAKTTVSIEFFRFHGTHDGNALVAGQWTIFGSQKLQPLHQQAFDLKVPLNEAGYGALVQSLGALLDLVGHDIEQYLKMDN